MLANRFGWRQTWTLQVETFLSFPPSSKVVCTIWLKMYIAALWHFLIGCTHFDPYYGTDHGRPVSVTWSERVCDDKVVWKVVVLFRASPGAVRWLTSAKVTIQCDKMATDIGSCTSTAVILDIRRHYKSINAITNINYIDTLQSRHLKWSNHRHH